MDLKSIILLIVSLLLIIESVIVLCNNRAGNRRIKNQFNLEKYAAKNELVKKKDAAEKEMTEEIEKCVEAARIAAQQEINQVEQNKQNQISLKEKELNVILNGYEEQSRRGKVELEQRLQSYKNDDIAARRRREIENEELLKETHLKYANSLKAIEDDYKDKKERLDKDFFSYSESISLKKSQLEEEIESYEKKQKEIISRFKADEEKKEKADFYRIQIKENDKEDIKKLRQVAEKLNNPTVLYKLIWENYYKNPFSQMTGRVVPPAQQGIGIYKITNINNGKCYIGQTRQPFATRWRAHVKRGVRAEPATRNKLYDEMWNEGVENFTFEVVTTCKPEELNEKEKYFIQFYNSNSYGYNSTSGNNG